MINVEIQSLRREIASLHLGVSSHMPPSSLSFCIMHGNGNVILVVDENISRLPLQYVSSAFVRELCGRVGTVRIDGVSFLRVANSQVKMSFFDRDGTAEMMCGNGLRCSAKYAYDQGYISAAGEIITDDGVKAVNVVDGVVQVSLGPGRELKKVEEGMYFVYTGVAHLVILCNDLGKVDVVSEGRRHRYDAELAGRLGHSEGLHVNFVQVTANGLQVRTYEVGVEDETLSCGTGVAASACIANRYLGLPFPVRVQTRGGEMAVRENSAAGLSISGVVEYIFHSDGAQDDPS